MQCCPQNFSYIAMQYIDMCIDMIRFARTQNKNLEIYIFLSLLCIDY